MNQAQIVSTNEVHALEVVKTKVITLKLEGLPDYEKTKQIKAAYEKLKKVKVVDVGQDRREFEYVFSELDLTTFQFLVKEFKTTVFTSYYGRKYILVKCDFCTLRIESVEIKVNLPE